MPGQRFPPVSALSRTTAMPVLHKPSSEMFSSQHDARPKTENEIAMSSADLCANCARPLQVESKYSHVQEGSAVYCCNNCRWTALLDTKGSRHRRAKRAAMSKDKVKRRRRQPVVIEEGEEMSRKSRAGGESDEEFGGDGGNAMFEYYSNASFESEEEELPFGAIFPSS